MRGGGGRGLGWEAGAYAPWRMTRNVRNVFGCSVTVEPSSCFSCKATQTRAVKELNNCNNCGLEHLGDGL
jgi:hypothetical protein